MGVQTWQRLASGLVRMRPGRRFSMTTQEEIAGYIAISPWLIGFVVFTVGPILASFLLSFTRYDIINPPEWIGLANYTRIFTDDREFRQALRVTLTYAAVTLPLSLVLGLGLSLLLNMTMRGMNLYRTLFYLPAVLPAVAVTLLWVWIFNSEFGILNWLLAQVGIEGPNWFQHPRYALPALMIMSLWGVGGGAVIYLAGLQNIAPHLYEAAEIDGANTWWRFWKVTIPMLTPTIFFQLIIGLIGSFQAFVQAYIATNGGPRQSTLFYMLYLYQKAFQTFRMGYGSALAWILAVIILVCTVLVFKSSALWVYYEAETPQR